MDKRILIVSMFSIVIITIPIWVGWICWISDSRGSKSARLTYKQFKAIYDVTPECFEMYSTWVEYEHNNIEFKSYRDVLLYRIFRMRKSKYDKRVSQIKNQAELIKLIQANLNKQQEEIATFIKEKADL